VVRPVAEGCRVIAGSARGVRLEVPRGAATRPLSDRVKQSLFGALEADGALEGPFLDLFAGTGAAGIEALSRGAPRATFVEHDARACATIASNLERAGLASGTVVHADVPVFLAERGGEGAPYRACLVDPPYDLPAVERTLELLGSAPHWLEDDGVVVAKHFWRDHAPDSAGRLARTRRRRFGETALTFYTLRR